MLRNFFILLLICGILLFFRERHLRSRSATALQGSIGVFDVQAADALDSIEKLSFPQPQDHMRAARIIDLHAHEGRINNTRVLDKAVSRYGKALGAADNLDWFEISQIEAFAHRYADELGTRPDYRGFVHRVELERPRKVLTDIEHAKGLAPTKRGAFSAYVDDAATFTSDEQNVHDSAVNVQLRSTIGKMKKSASEQSLGALKPSKSSLLNIITKDIEKAYGSDVVRKRRAEEALKSIEKDVWNECLGVTEMEVLQLVWGRQSRSENHEVAEAMKMAVLDSLVDMTELAVEDVDGHTIDVVCSNGRCARLIESLVHLDMDQSTVQGAVTVEQIRNDAFTMCKSILEETLEAARQGSEPGLALAATAYDEANVDVSEEDEARLKDMVNVKVKQELEMMYSRRLPDQEFERLLNHCLLAINSL